jgi:hypothetical protein
MKPQKKQIPPEEIVILQFSRCIAALNEGKLEDYDREYEILKTLFL